MIIITVIIIIKPDKNERNPNVEFVWGGAGGAVRFWVLFSFNFLFFFFFV